MDRLTATKLRDHALEAAKCIMKGVEVVNSELTGDEARDVRRQLGAVLFSINEELLLSIFRAHPDLIPEEIRDSTRRRLGLDAS